MAGVEGSAELPFEKLSSQFLQCPLCFEQFRSPKVLPCQHTFCLACIRQYVATRGLDHEVPCPMCKEMVIIPGNDVTRLKNNFMIVSLLHFVEDSKSAQPPSNLLEMQVNLSSEEDQAVGDQTVCGACGEPGLLVSFCQICALCLCSICTKAHKRLPSTSGHTVMTSEEVDAQCKSVISMMENTLGKFQQANTERFDSVLTQIQQVPENVTLIKKKIESAAEEAHKVITVKMDDLLCEVNHFQENQEKDLSQTLESIEKRKNEMDRLQENLTAVKLSNDGFRNQNLMKTVERYINKSSVADFDAQGGHNMSLAYTAFSNNLNELKNMDMGHLRVVNGETEPNILLNDRPLGMHKIASLEERVYISALAINRFADKFVVANNETVLVFKPDSVSPKPLLSPLSERNVNKPWGIAYSEDDRRVYISEAGRHEGDGAIISYSHDGAFHSLIASGMTMPRGIAVHKSYIFVCDQIDKSVYIFNMWGKVIRVLKKTPDGKYIFNGPMFISVGKTGIIAVSDNCTSVKIFDKDCNLMFTYASSLPESQFWDVHVMQNGTVVVCDWKHGLHKISPDLNSNGLVKTESNAIREPSALAALENGSCVYIGTCGGEIYSAI